MKQSHITSLSYIAGSILIFLGIARYLIFYEDYFRGGTLIILGAVLWFLGYLYNRVQSQSYTIIAMEDYLGDKK